MLANPPGTGKLPDDEHDIMNFNYLLELTSRIRLRLHQPASVRMLQRYPANWLDRGDNLYSDNQYRPYRWHHLVGQMNGNQIEVYVDGISTPPLSVDPSFVNNPVELLLGRLTLVPREHDNTSRSFVGRMDEVAIYDHPLSVAEIQAHQRLAGPPAQPRSFARPDR